MFGYVRPLRCELRVREWEFFNSSYCGLCQALAQQYGFWSRYLLSYDFTVLSLALSVYEAPVDAVGKRCPANPFFKRNCRGGAAAELAADLTVLLTMGRLRDTVADESSIRGLTARLALLFLSRAGARAARRQPDAHDCVTRELERLRAYEETQTDALDPPADAFATLLSGLARNLSDEEGRRVLTHLFYHLGRWIYLMDACDDLPADAGKGAYNPVAARYGLEDGRMTDEAIASVRETTCLSRLEILKALNLMPDTPALPILENIFGLGLPRVEEQVLAGIWQKRRRIHERPI